MAEAPLYREAWLKDHQPIRVGKSLVIGPRGTRRAAADADRVIELDVSLGGPATGVVFGTGAHATTRLALEFLEEHLRSGDRVLDVGTGSGVLALAAARLGAREVLAIDIDPLAVVSARTNVALNDLGQIVQVREEGSLQRFGAEGDSGGVVEVVDDGSYDLVLANILSPVIRQLASDLWRLLRPGGLLIVAGIVAVEAEDVETALGAFGFRSLKERVDGDWAAFVFSRGESKGCAD